MKWVRNGWLKLGGAPLIYQDKISKLYYAERENIAKIKALFDIT